MHAYHRTSLLALALLLSTAPVMAQGAPDPKSLSGLKPSSGAQTPAPAPSVDVSTLAITEMRSKTAVPGLQVGDRVTAVTGNWTPAGTRVTHQWLRCKSVSQCAPIQGETGPTHMIVAADEDNRLSFSLVATGPTGVVTRLNGPMSSPVLKKGELAPKLRAPVMVEIRGLAPNAPPPVGAMATSQPGQWDKQVDRAEQVQWERCDSNTPNACHPISGATKPSYPITTADLGKYIRYVLTVSANGAEGSGESNIVGPVVAKAPEAKQKP